jgi:hypothetical protein
LKKGKNKNRIFLLLGIVLITMIPLAGCSLAAVSDTVGNVLGIETSQSEESSQDTSSVNSQDSAKNDALPNQINVVNNSDSITRTPGMYDSEDTAVVVKKNLEERTIQLQNLATSRRYTLTYDGTTKLFDRYDEVVSMEQIQEASLVTVRFYKPDKALTYLKIYPEGVYYNNVQNYTMDLKEGTFRVGDESYNISGHIVVVSGGREVDLMDVNEMDVLSVWGSNSMIYGINVERGHGYLRLQNETYFLNGWIEVGDKIIRKISEDMLLVVPEGAFRVTVSHKGSSATQEIQFGRNEEMAWDLGEVEITIVQKGSIIFTVTPATAKVSIDGREVDISKPVELEYGLHRMRVTAEGYDTVAQYIKVGEPSANIEIALEQSEESTQEEESSQSKKSEADANESSDSKPVSSKSGMKSSNSDKDEEEEEEKPSQKPSNDEEDEESENKSAAVSANAKYRVYIDAPEGAEVYLDGNYVGVTPTNFPKKEGGYVVTLRRAGYQTRSYTLQIDGEEKDVNYSFTELIKLEE